MSLSSASRRWSPARFAEAALALALAALPAHGAVVCSGSSTSMSLGTYYGDTAAPTDSAGTFMLTCTRNGGPQNVTVTMGIGASGNSGSIANRQMRTGSWPDTLAYNLYRDAARLGVWGETVGVDTVSSSVSVPNNASRSVAFTIYGRIPGLQNVHTGFYSDTLVVTINY
jgi:spore coat protein U-like protein